MQIALLTPTPLGLMVYQWNILPLDRVSNKQINDFGYNLGSILDENHGVVAAKIRLAKIIKAFF